MTLEFADPALNGGASRLMDPAFRAHYFTILRLCMRQLGDRSDAEDAAQETFRRALQQREGMIGDPLPWLIAVARNVCIDELRRRKTGRGALERSAARSNETRAEGENAENPERVVVGRMFVNELLRQLTPAERRVVAGTIVDGQCGGELAASLGVTASTARVLLARARGKLRRYLEDGQGAIPAVCFAGWRAADRVRQRILTRPWALQSRPEMLLPALVVSAIVTAAMAPQSTAAPPSAGAFEPSLATAHRVDMFDDSVGHGTTVTAAVPVGPAAGTALGHAGGHAPVAGGGSPLDSLLPAPNPNWVGVTDFAPSPNYSSDHTVYMLGGGNRCILTCTELFRSADGGATWTYVPNSDLTGTDLLVPQSGYADGLHFFAGGGNVLQVTRDGGAHFDDYGVEIQTAVVAPAWLNAELVTADTTLSFIDGTQVPHVVAAFPPGDTAAGTPLLLPGGPGGFTALQAVQNDVLGGYTLLSCGTGGCAPMGTIPVTGPVVQIIASPDVATDHTVVAVGGGVAVSHDGGATFVQTSSQAMEQAVAVPGPQGTRLIAVDTARTQGGNSPLMYSDDLGTTWRPAGLPRLALGAIYVRAPRLLAAGRLIASAADPRRPGMNVFVCSADGALWSACSPQ